jgi:signal transduction histidine kinase
MKSDTEDTRVTHEQPDRAALIEIVARLSHQVDELSVELAETNAGVVALYSELDDRAEQLKQASDLKSRFLSYMSHEFRTPLGAINSLCRLLLDRVDGPLTSEQEIQIKLMKNSAHELSEMVDDLLDLAKVEAGRVTISPEWFEMVDLFSALRGMFRPILAEGSVDLIFEEPKNVPDHLYTDHKKLSQILRNFISNALKFTPQGQVRVAANYDGGDDITFSVSDTGIGISADEQTKLFHDFVQLDTRMQKRLRGSGLGLSLSKKLAELLGGSVKVESELGVGSVFSVTIPVKMSGPDASDMPKHATTDQGALFDGR